MALKFNSTEEIKLQDAPLDEVICQIRFAPILSISRDLPVDFQEKVRHRFPNYKEIQNFVLQIPNAGNTEKIPAEIPKKTYQFMTGDKLSYIGLATDSISLSTKNYTHWDNFLLDLTILEHAAKDVLSFSLINRIGLRYINRISTQTIKVDSTEGLLGIFREELTCLLTAKPWSTPEEMFTQIIIPDDQRKLALRLGFGREKEEDFFIIDIDYYEEVEQSYEITKLNSKLESYHSKIYETFRWCVKEDGIKLFNPIVA